MPRDEQVITPHKFRRLRYPKKNYVLIFHECKAFVSILKFFHTISRSPNSTRVDMTLYRHEK